MNDDALRRINLGYAWQFMQSRFASNMTAAISKQVSGHANGAADFHQG